MIRYIKIDIKRRFHYFFVATDVIFKTRTYDNKSLRQWTLHWTLDTDMSVDILAHTQKNQYCCT